MKKAKYQKNYALKYLNQQYERINTPDKNS
jgi:hypothetical protein